MTTPMTRLLFMGGAANIDAQLDGRGGLEPYGVKG